MDKELLKKSIGKRIRDLRIQHNISQETIAEEIGMSRSNFSQIEIGNQYPTLAALYDLSHYYGRNYDWIINGNPYSAQRQAINEMDSVIVNIESAIIDLKESLEKIRSKIDPNQE